MLNIAFRLDDAFSYSKSDASQKLLEVFKEINAPVTIGLIPKAFSTEQEAIISEDKYMIQLTRPSTISPDIEEVIRWSDFDVFMHGLTHANTATGEETGISMFPRAVVENKIFLENLTKR